MNNALEQFRAVLAEFSAESGVKAELEEDNSVFITVGEDTIVLNYLPKSEQVVAWASVGFLGHDDKSEKRLELLLKWNDDPKKTEGFSFAFNPEEDRVILHDRRCVLFLDSGDKLATWLGIMLDVLEHVRKAFDEELPFEAQEEVDLNIEAAIVEE